MSMDFAGLAARLLQEAPGLMAAWLPGGQIRGREYECANLQGGKGQSLKINMQTGLWMDFATGEKGGDLIDLFAAIRNISQGEAAKDLSQDFNYNLRPDDYRPPVFVPPAEAETGAPPSEDMLDFPFAHPEHGRPSNFWVYRSEAGEPLFVSARYETKDGKQVLPWSWHLAKNKWVMKAYPTPRPLYGLENLAQYPKRQVLLVEGEKTKDAAQRIVGERMICMTWPGGAQGIEKVDWAPLAGRQVVVLPDADLKRLSDGSLKPYDAQPGPAAANKIAKKLKALNCEIKLVDVGLEESRADGWDLADAEADGWDWLRFETWVKPRLRKYGAEPESKNLMTAPEMTAVPSVFAMWEKMGLCTTKNGQPIMNSDNVVRILEGDENFKGQIWYDTFHNCMFTQFDLITMRKLDAPRPWIDRDDLQLLLYIQRHLGLVKMTKELVICGISTYAACHEKNEVQDWLNSLTWDGKARLETFLERALGLNESRYIRAVSRNWFLSIAARIIEPGCKVDTMLILQGEQGSKKSSMLSIIGGKWFAEVSTSIDSKDFYLDLQGKLIIEISEMAAFSRATEEARKKMLTQQADRYRTPYGRISQDHPRQCVFAGSTNEDGFLGDPTGARRYWPTSCKNIDLDLVRAEREQVFAEALALFKVYQRTRDEKDGWWLMPADELAAIHEKFRLYDDLEEPLLAWINKEPGREELSFNDMVYEALSLPAGKIDLPLQRRIGKILRGLGWSSKAVYGGAGTTKRAWMRIKPMELI